MSQLEADLDGCVMSGNMLHEALSSTQDKVEQLEAENAAHKRESEIFRKWLKMGGQMTEYVLWREKHNALLEKSDD